MTRASNIPALERATNRGWDAWVAELTARNAAALTHTEIAALARERMPAGLQNPDWWAQGVAIAYAQHIGRRQPGQSAAGDFRAGATKTIRAAPDAAVAAWLARFGGVAELDGVPAAKERLSQTEKRRVWRIDLADGGRVSVEFTGTPERTGVAVQHGGLGSPEDIARWKPVWKAALDELAGSLAEAAPGAE
ncbi:hypothetical protein [Leucobacter sp. M11]|uniref:hypothetical protein n=1 Tax=Leucobacter sp. M11 TaxID=2993565 RepID=UPI002D7FA575|nr:hypothetical protein [Leucobacter sp. M11]MEB4613630.1 hypothetical protein [Leucobacter sp. M11]